MNDESKKRLEENGKELSLGSALDEIGFARVGRRVIVGQRAERKPLVVRIGRPNQNTA